MPEVGAVLGDKYRLERLVARGGMGSVWLAAHLELHMPVAVKLLRADMAGADRPEERFLREARALARVQSPHVVQVLDFGRSDDEAYLVMEFLEGQDLALVLEQQGALEPGLAIVLAAQAARGLAAAHHCGLVHRDLKPSNLFLTGGPAAPLVKVIDFGIVKRIDTSDGETTRAGTVLGSPAYMSPEQARGAEVSVASDVWSLSAVLYRMLTGQRPFSGVTDHDLIVRICSTDVTPVSSIRAELPRGFDEFFARALARDASRRLVDLRDWQEALLRVCVASPAFDEARRELEGLTSLVRNERAQLSTAQQQANEEFERTSGSRADLRPPHERWGSRDGSSVALGHLGGTATSVLRRYPEARSLASGAFDAAAASSAASELGRQEATATLCQQEVAPLAPSPRADEERHVAGEELRPPGQALRRTGALLLGGAAFALGLLWFGLGGIFQTGAPISGTMAPGTSASVAAEPAATPSERGDIARSPATAPSQPTLSADPAAAVGPATAAPGTPALASSVSLPDPLVRPGLRQAGAPGPTVEVKAESSRTESSQKLSSASGPSGASDAPDSEPAEATDPIFGLPVSMP